MPQSRVLLGVLTLLFHVTSASAAEPPKVEKQRITAASGVRMRAEPKPTGKEVARLFIGTALRELERSEKQETVGGKKDSWYRVATPEGQEGWVFGSFLWPLEPERRVETWLELTKQRLTDDKAPFADRADLANFLDGVVAQAPDKASSAQLELAHWRAVRWALDVPPDEGRPMYEKWVKRQGEAVVYSEPAGMWFVDTNLLWKLEEKYRDQPVAEAIAWEAATTPTPGECEGYPPCYLSRSDSSEGEYLKRYPTGAHVKEALAAMEEVLSQDGIRELEKEDRAEVIRELDELAASISKVEPEEKKKVVAKLQAMKKAVGR